VDALPAEGLAHDVRHLDRRLLGEDRLHERGGGEVVMEVVEAVAARHLHRRRLGRVDRVADGLGADADAGNERDQRRDEGLLLAAVGRGRAG
jgi:hypothetical protein